MSSTIKAVRATILLGDIQIEGYQMPDGQYKVSQQTFKDTLNSLIGDSTGKKYLKPILEASKSMVKTRIEGYARLINLYGLETFSEVVAAYAQLGNQKAIAILIACMAESLELRFDTAFGIVREERERNERFVVRKESILSRHFWTDCIDQYCKTHEVSDNYRKWVYIHVSDFLNKSLFGKTSKEIRDHYNIGDQSPRDYFPSETIKIVDTIEKATALRVLQTDSEPKQALKDVVALLGVEKLPL